MNPGLRHGKGELAIWQRRFWEHHLHEEADYRADLHYCWMTLVKHGLL